MAGAASQMASAQTMNAVVPPTVPPAHVVGTSFVHQYYSILHSATQHLHRFYTEASTFTRAEPGPEGATETVIGQREIHSKVMALDYADSKAEIKSVDSQYSLNGGVIVAVTGALTNRSRGKRNFVHTFFLAPQETGYYVLNDILRYLDGEAQQTIRAHSVQPVANGLPEGQTVRQQANSQPSEKEPTRAFSPPKKPAEAAAAPKKEVVIEQAEEASQAGGGAVEPGVDEHGDEQEGLEVSPPAAEDAAQTDVQAEAATEVEAEPEDDKPKQPMSYALALKMKNAAPVSPSPVHEKPREAAPEPVQSQPGPPVPAAADVAEPVDEGNEQAENDGCSVFIRNLPQGITNEALCKELAKYGSLKPGSINIRQGKFGTTSVFAFVDFDDQASAQSAIEAAPLNIDGRSVSVEEKRPQTRTNRGGRPGPTGQGRGDRTFRADMIGRGRAPNPYGRTGSRGPMNSDRSELGSRDMTGRDMGGRGRAMGSAQGRGPGMGQDRLDGGGRGRIPDSQGARKGGVGRTGGGMGGRGGGAARGTGSSTVAAA